VALYGAVSCTAYVCFTISLIAAMNEFFLAGVVLKTAGQKVGVAQG